MELCKCLDFPLEHPRSFDLTNRVFGQLTATKTHCIFKQRLWWLCQCACGNSTWGQSHELKTGHKASCGCRQGKYRHGFCHTRIWMIYNEMKQRILNPNKPEYYKYGGRGIKICKGWLAGIINFAADMGEPPSVLHTLDRKNNNGNYSCGKCPECLENGWPANCRWATKREQQRNRRTNRMITAFDQTKTLAEWAENAGLKGYHIADRLKHNWLPEDAVTFPVGTKGYHRRKQELQEMHR